MKIAELLQEESIHDYKRRLKAVEKIKSLGDGAYGEVFQHPTEPNLVVKVFNYKEDRNYMKFLKWAKANQDNPYLPKIVEVFKFKDVPPPLRPIRLIKKDGSPRNSVLVKREQREAKFKRDNAGYDSHIGIVFMKKLKPCPSATYNKLYRQAVSALKKSADYKSDKSIRSLVDELLGEFNDFQHWPRFAWALLAKNTPDKHFAAFCDFMSRSNDGDLHDENIMVDTNGQIVITDPVA